MPSITRHKESDLNQHIAIEADERDAQCGNASHVYIISINSIREQAINFQHGAVKEVGVNGISDEALIAVLIDRLEGFNSGNFRCRQNSIAITKLEEALMWLQNRTKDRMERGVEGLSKV